MTFRQYHKNPCLVPTLFLFIQCLALSSLHYFSSYIANTKASITHFQKQSCMGRLIYIHTLPSKFNQDLLRDCQNLNKQVNFCPFLTNRGFGVQMNNSNWYVTNQFTLSVIFHNRMKQYECLTNDSSLANAIYAPFYPGLEVRRFLLRGFNESVRDAMGQDFVRWLRGRPEWGVMSGWDHFFVSGRVTWELRRLTNPNGGWGSHLLDLPESQNMTILTIESSPYGRNDFAIPYPTHFHPSSDGDVVQWQDHVRKAKRQNLFAFSGASRPNIATSIRDELITECGNSSRCIFLNCQKNVLCDSPGYVIRVFIESDFCLQPPGDSYTRRSTFDSILAGCIPVFFHPGSAYTQYMWHFPKEYTKYSVFIPMESVKNRSVSVEEVLSGVPEEDVKAMREEVIGLIPKIIYAQKTLDKFEDAFDIAVKNVLSRIQNVRRLIGEVMDPSKEFPEELSWKYYLTGKLENHEWDSLFRSKGT